MQLRTVVATGLVLLAGPVALSGCASTNKRVADVSGSYRFQAEGGDQILTGVLVISRTADDDWTGRIAFDRSGALKTIGFEIEGSSFRLTAEGRGPVVRVHGTISGSEIRGTWSGGAGAGGFHAQKDAWGQQLWAP